MVVALRPKQAVFVQEYLIDLNATQAAIRAGYSVKTAQQVGSQNLSKLVIQAALQEAMAARADRTEVTADQVVKELALIGFANMADYADWGPEGVKLKAAGNLPEGAAAAVAEVSEHSTESTRTVRFKLHDKLGALNILAKHLGMFMERKEINANTDWRFTIGRGYDGPLITQVEIIMPPDSETERTETVDGVVTRVE